MAADAEALLNELGDGLADAKPSSGMFPVRKSGGIAKVSYTHDALIDLIIADPCITQDAMAMYFGYTPGWISQIIASDAFQARLAERKDSLVDPTIRATIEDHFKAMVTRSLAILREKLNQPTSQVPANLALKTLEISSKALGYGARPDTPVPPITGEDRLKRLEDRLIPLLQRGRAEGAVINGKAESVEAETVREGSSPDGSG